MGTDFKKAVERVCEVVMFENWLRFYFIEEGADDSLVMNIPAKGIEQLHAHYPGLVGLAEKLNGKGIDHQESVASVCMFVASEIDGVSVSEQTMSRVFDSKDFQVSMQLFSAWVQAHEEQLDASFMEFSLWKGLFVEWLGDSKVQTYKKQLEDQFMQVTTEETSTVQ